MEDPFNELIELIQSAGQRIWSWGVVTIFGKTPNMYLKGILHQKIFYRLNLIFWIVMGCGIARFGRRGLKITKTWKFWSQNLSPGVSRRSRPGVSRHSTRGFEAQHQGFRGAATWGFEGQQHGTWRHSNTDRTPQWFIISCCPSRSHLTTRDLKGWYHRWHHSDCTPLHHCS